MGAQPGVRREDIAMPVDPARTRVAPGVVQPRPQCCVYDMAFAKWNHSVCRYVDLVADGPGSPCAISWLAETDDSCGYGEPCVLGEVLRERRRGNLPGSE